jgi:hypothetical protein
MPLLPTQAAELKIKANIRNLNLRGTPAEAVLCRVGHQVWNFAGNEALMAEQICRNMHWYGQTGNPAWVWDIGSNPANNTGEALARGGTVNTNCGGFNLSARWIGINVVELDATQFVGSYTQASDYFITGANTIGIDRNWLGNVRTITQDFAQLRAYFFKGHSWCKYGNNMLDASTDTMNFRSKFDLYWCALNDVTLVNGRVFLVSNRYKATAIPGTAPYACLSHTSLQNNKHHFPIVLTGAAGQGLVTQSFISQMPARSGHGWENMLLASCADLPAAYRAAVGLP